MSEPYTPTTSQVRGYYIACGAEFDPDDGAVDEFYRWLAEHDKEVLEGAVERIEDACKHERVYRGYVLCDACNAAISAVRGDGE